MIKIFRNNLHLFFISFLIFILAGCSLQTHFKDTDIRPLHDSVRHFIDYTTGKSGNLPITGIRQALADSPNNPIRILALHGMITNESKYSEDMQKRIGDKLGLVLSANKVESIIINRGYNFNLSLAVGKEYFDGPDGDGLLKTSMLRKYSWVNPKKPNIERLVYYEALWAPLRDQIKNELFACFESHSVNPKVNCPTFKNAKRNPDSRTLINNMLKDKMFINGFADPIILIGPAGDVVKDDVMLATCIIANDVLKKSNLKQFSRKRCDLSSFTNHLNSRNTAENTLEDTKFFAVTHSLGSFLFMDTEQRFALANLKTENDSGKLTDEEMQEDLLFALTGKATVYMMANQVALLQLARFSIGDCEAYDGKSKCPNKLLRNRKDPMDMGDYEYGDLPIGTTNYVAFNDANDLLGYDLPPHLQKTGIFGSIVNVSVKNPGFSIPFIFKMPSHAHTHQAGNPAIIDTMVEGLILPTK